MGHTFNESCPVCGGICVQRRRYWPEIEEDLPFLYEEEPDAKVETGFTPSEGATDLEIFYRNGNTYLCALGECQNGGPYWSEGIIPVAEVLDDYRRELMVELAEL